MTEIENALPTVIKTPSVSIETHASEVQVIDLTKAIDDIRIDEYLANSQATASGVVSILEAWTAQRERWENTELAASHGRLYAILTRCYEFYLAMKFDPTKSVRTQLVDGLEQFIKGRGLRIQSNTHDMVKVVKAVFGDDRRRVSAYAMALRAALVAGHEVGAKTSHIPADQLTAWIVLKGGVEEIRLGGKSSTIAVQERVDLAVMSEEVVHPSPI